MKIGNKTRIVGLMIAGLLAFTAEFETLAASPKSEAQTVSTVRYEKKKASMLAASMNEISEMADLAEDTQKWQGKALPDIKGKAYIYAKKSTKSKPVGQMYESTVLKIVKEGKKWSKVKSGSVKGYVKSKVLLTGSYAVHKAEVACADGMKKARAIEELKTEKMLAGLIFCEAGNQPYDGKVAVGAVVMNRVKSSRFPNSIKEVIYQSGQFTPAMTGKLDRIISANSIPESCYEAARDALDGKNPVGNALFFNTGHGKFKLGDHYFS